MAPDSDVKDRIDDPEQNLVLDAGYSSFYAEPVAEEDEDGEEDGGSEGSSSFGPARDEVAETSRDLINILFSAGERPWENEALSPAERMAMIKVFRTNNPDAQSRAEREEFEFRIRARSSAGHSVNVAPVVAAAGAIAAKEKTPTEKAPGNPEPVQDKVSLRLRSEPFIREYGQDGGVDKNLKAALGIGPVIGMPSSLAMLNRKPKPGENQTPVDYLGLAASVAREMQVQVRPEVVITPTPQSRSRDVGFVQALGLIYSALTTETLLNITPYREAVWNDKRLQQKENLLDITFRAPQPAIRIPAPAPSLDRDYKMNMSVPALR